MHKSQNCRISVFPLVIGCAKKTWPQGRRQLCVSWLTVRGFLTKSGKAFPRYSFQEIIRNEKYTGVYIFNKSEGKGYDHKRNSHKYKPSEEIIRVEGGIPAIISRETWEAANAKRISGAHPSGCR